MHSYGGHTFFLLEDGTGNGTFNTVDFTPLDPGAGFTITARTTTVQLVINGTTAATPEPGGLFMLAVGLGLLLFRGKATRA